jgi:hypothetical protein
MIADLGLRIAECDFQIEDWDSSDLGFGIADCGLEWKIGNPSIKTSFAQDSNKLLSIIVSAKNITRKQRYQSNI